MTGNPRKIVGVFATLLVVWIATYWLYEPKEPPITYGHAPSGMLDTPLLAAVERDETPPALTPAPSTDPKQLVKVVEPPKFKDYVVQRGDVSWDAISRHVYGTPKNWEAISRANPLVTPDRLIVGKTKLRIPLDPGNVQGKVVTVPVPSAAPSPAAPTAIAADSGKYTEYVVEEGDTLSGISKKVYGKSSFWQQIVDANKDKIADPSKVKAGMHLRIPALSTTH